MPDPINTFDEHIDALVHHLDDNYWPEKHRALIKLIAERNDLAKRVAELEAKPPADSKYELTLLKIRNLVAEQEMNRSSSDREIAIGGWLYDHGSEHIRLQLEIDRLFSDLAAMRKGEQ